MDEDKKTESVSETAQQPETVANASKVIESGRPKWLVPAIAAGAAVVLVGAGFGGWHAYTTHELNVAKTACAQASESVREAANSYNLVVNGDAADASAIKVDQVKDAKTVDALAKALKETAPEYKGCVADGKDGLDAATVKLNSQAKWYESHEKTLDAAVKAVTESKAAKALETAKDALSKKVDEASKLLSDSDGKVQDNATRETLTKAIDSGNKLKDGKEPSKLDEARKTLELAIKGVNDSIAAKTKADEEAAAAAAAAQAAAAQSNPYSNTTYRRSTSSGGSYQRTSTRRGNAAPAPRTTAPAPAPTPSGDEYEQMCSVTDTSGKPGTWVPCSSVGF